MQLATQKPPIGGKLRTSEVVYLHTDHLNSPRVGTDALGKVVWNWQSDAFGVSVASSTQGNKFLVNLRFPGQFFDAETGLYYNYHRYYDPQTGRYITSDPIGLAGGLNTFGYVGGNPVRFVDPKGEALQLCIANPGICINVVRLCYTAVKAIAAGYIVETYDCEENNNCKKDDASSPPAPPPENKKPCQQPNSIYDLVDGNGNLIGTILYKDIPYGAFITFPPVRAGSCGRVPTNTMHVTGGAVNDISGISGGK